MLNIYYFMMKINILLFTCLLFLFLGATHQQETILTYIIEHEIDQYDHFVELELTVQTQGRSLNAAISTASNIIKRIEQISKSYCLQQSKNKKQCEEIVDATKYTVQPKYHLVRKIETFTLFIVTHQLTITIRNLKNLGKMIDDIIQAGNGFIVLNNFAWKTDQELDADRETLKQGISQGKELCEKLGKILSGFISVQQLEVPQQEEGEDDERDEDLAEQEIELSIFKFKVKCSDPPVKAKAVKKNKK